MDEEAFKAEVDRLEGEERQRLAAEEREREAEERAQEELLLAGQLAAEHEAAERAAAAKSRRARPGVSGRAFAVILVFAVLATLGIVYVSMVRPLEHASCDSRTL